MLDGRGRKTGQARLSEDRMNRHLSSLTISDLSRFHPPMRKLLALCKKHNIENWAEEWPLNDTLPLLRKCFGLKPNEEFVAD